MANTTAPVNGQMFSHWDGLPFQNVVSSVIEGIMGGQEVAPQVENRGEIEDFRSGGTPQPPF